MVTVFLSHSSRDKEDVRRLAQELRKRNISVWLDEWEIHVGESIAQRVSEGLSNAQYVAVWLSPDAVTSGWVTKEWQPKIFNEISQKNVVVLPLLAKDCEIPFFLSDKKYADFRLSFRDGFAELMRTLSRQNLHAERTYVRAIDFTVTDLTRGFLRDLEDAFIPFPTVGNLKIVKTLKTLPRSGKLLRLENMHPPVAIRSVYDHILSLAHSADCFLNITEPRLPNIDRTDLARVIAYHDLCEIILGDIPQYTTLNRAKRRRANISAQIRLARLPNGIPERITNQFIAMFLNDSESQSLYRAMDLIESNSDLWKFAYALDKIDPILAVWRYLAIYRGNQSFDVNEFFKRMKHFFENPLVRKAISMNVADPRMVDLVDKLQDRSNAKRYFEDASLLSENLFDYPHEIIHKLIEGRKLEFVPKVKSRTRVSIKLETMPAG